MDTFDEFADRRRIQAWSEAGDLAAEALGHAVALREHLYRYTRDVEAQERARILVDVLTAALAGKR